MRQNGKFRDIRVPVVAPKVFYDTKAVAILDRVRTRSGRMGICINTIGRDTAVVRWDDGEVFAIRFCHLEVLAHNCEVPAKFSKNRPE